MPASGKERIAEFYEEVANRGNIDRVDEFCTEDFVEHEEFAGFPPNREGVKQYMRMMRSAFPDMRMEIESIMQEGDRVMARFHMTGTHQGDFMGIAPTGRRIDMHGYDEVLMEGDRAREHWGAMDGMEMMQQLGVAPEMTAH